MPSLYIYIDIDKYKYIYIKLCILWILFLWRTLTNKLTIGSSVHGIFQARVLEWDAISFSDMEQQNGSNLEKEYIKVVYCHPAYLTVYCHPAYLTYMQIMSCRMSGWMNHKLEPRLHREILITSYRQITPP